MSAPQTDLAANVADTPPVPLGRGATDDAPTNGTTVSDPGR